MSGGGRTLTWDTENRVASVTANGATETSTYDADGERVARTANGQTTLYFGGLWEQTVGGSATKYYSFNGDVVAMRTTANNAVTFLHGDHLGSVSLATSSAGTLVSRQYFDPYGSVRGGNMPTARNYTGQLRDSSGLLYYHARYYGPGLGRFLSPDTVVPGAANGSLDGIALKALTVSVQEPALLARLNSENRGGNARLYRGGPLNPQALNRYAYVLNNPVNATDPTGHDPRFPKCLCGGGSGSGVANAGRGGQGVRPAGAARAAGDAATVVVGAALIADGVQGTTQQVQAKPLQPDERKLIGRIDQIPDFLAEHPDLAEEAERVNQGESLALGQDHIREAENRVRSLEKSIRTLQGVRKNRDAAGQRDIDAAVSRAQDYLRTLKRILSP